MRTSLGPLLASASAPSSPLNAPVLLLPAAARALLAPPVWQRQPGRYPHLFLERRRANNRALKHRSTVLHIRANAAAGSREAAVELRSVEAATVDDGLTAGDIVELRAVRGSATTRTSSYTDPVGTLVGYGFYEPQMKSLLPVPGAEDAHAIQGLVTIREQNQAPTSSRRDAPEAQIPQASNGRIACFAYQPHAGESAPQAVVGAAATAPIIDEDFWAARLEHAVSARRGLLPNARTVRTDGYRMLHGDGDGVPGVFVDAYGPHMRVMRVTSVGALRHAAGPILRLLLGGGGDGLSSSSAGGGGVARQPSRPVAVLVEVAESVLHAATPGGVAALSAVSLDDQTRCCEHLQQLLSAPLPRWFGTDADMKVYPVRSQTAADAGAASASAIPSTTTRPGMVGLFFVPSASLVAVRAQGRKAQGNALSFFSEMGIKVLAPDPPLPGAGGAPPHAPTRRGIRNERGSGAFDDDVPLSSAKPGSSKAGTGASSDTDALEWATVPVPSTDFALRAARRLIRELTPSRVVAIDGDTGGGFTATCALGCASRIATFAGDSNDAAAALATLRLNELIGARGSGSAQVDLDDDDDDDAAAARRSTILAAPPSTPAADIAVVPARLSSALAAAASGSRSPQAKATGKRGNYAKGTKKALPLSPALALPAACDTLLAHLSLRDVDSFIQTLHRYRASRQSATALAGRGALSPETMGVVPSGTSGLAGAADGRGTIDQNPTLEIDLNLSLAQAESGRIEGGPPKDANPTAASDTQAEFEAYSTEARAAMAAWCPTDDIHTEANATAIAAVAAHHVRGLLPVLALIRRNLSSSASPLDVEAQAQRHQDPREANVVLTTELGATGQRPFVQLKTVARFLPAEQMALSNAGGGGSVVDASTTPRMLWTVTKEMEAYGADFPLPSGADAVKERLDDLVAIVLTVRPVTQYERGLRGA